MAVFLRPKGDDVARIYGEYYSMAEVLALRVGDVVDILCTDGLNYHAEVKEIDDGVGLLHFPFWPKSFDYDGPLLALYLAEKGRYSAGITEASNRYRRVFPARTAKYKEKWRRQREREKEAALKVAMASGEASHDSQTSSKKKYETRYDDDFLAKPRHQLRNARNGSSSLASSNNNNTASNSVVSHRQPDAKESGQERTSKAMETRSARRGGEGVRASTLTLPLPSSPGHDRMEGSRRAPNGLIGMERRRSLRSQSMTASSPAETDIEAHAEEFERPSETSSRRENGANDGLSAPASEEKGSSRRRSKRMEEIQRVQQRKETETETEGLSLSEQRSSHSSKKRSRSGLVSEETRKRAADKDDAVSTRRLSLEILGRSPEDDESEGEDDDEVDDSILNLLGKHDLLPLPSASAAAHSQRGGVTVRGRNESSRRRLPATRREKIDALLSNLRKMKRKIEHSIDLLESLY